jgi:hypothetical protein
MALYQCLIRGENFPGVLVGKDTPVGFHATRFVEADSEDDAEARALDLLFADEALHVAPEQQTEDAEVFFERIFEVAPDTDTAPNAGFAFFAMEK